MYRTTNVIVLPINTELRNYMRWRQTMNSKQSVAIILLNWNTYQDSYECLKSLESLFILIFMSF